MKLTTLFYILLTANLLSATEVKAQSKVDATSSSLKINEIMVANVDQHVSPDFNFTSWIELYNPTSQSVSIAGLYFSDDAGNLKKWKTPATMGSIPAKGYKVIWFDNSNLVPTNVNFKLDMDGGTVYISDAKGSLIASQTYPKAVQRVSYAATTDGGIEWGLTSNPTIGASNSSSEFASAQVSSPVVDKSSQLFTGELTINVSIPDRTTLRYTTDGTLPTLTNGITSSNGIFTIKGTSCMRFRLFKQGFLASDVVTRSYILNNRGYSLPVISVVGDPKFLYDNQLGVMVRGTNGRRGNGQSTPCNWNMDWERPVNFSYISPDGEMLLNQDVDLEMAGGWSRAWEPHSFKLKGSKEYGGNKNLDYPFFSAKPYIRNRTILLRNGGNDNNCRIKDAALNTIIQTSGIDIDLQSYQPVHEFINGNYIGVLNMREPNNKHYAYANYGWDDEQIEQFEMSPDSGYIQKVGDGRIFKEIHRLSADAASPSTYEQIKKHLNIDEYINYMAMEFYLGSADWPHNNQKGFAKSEDGRLRLVSFDLDGTLSTTNSFYDFAGRQTFTFNYLYDSPVNRITKEIELVTIFLNLIQNKQFRKQFIDTYCLIAGSVFEPNRCTAIIDSLTNNIAGPMQIEGTSPYTTANSMKNALRYRPATMINTLQAYHSMQLQGAIKQSVKLSSNINRGKLLINDIEVPTGKFNGTLFAPVVLKAETPAGYVFKGWRQAGGANTTTVFKTGEAWSYYDRGSLDNTNWNAANYNANWQIGNAPLGYGNAGNINTSMSYGSNSQNKYTTYYFRKTFNVNKAPEADTKFQLNFSADDGFIVYINGTEAARYNMPEGNVTFSTLSSTYAAGNPDNGTIALPANLFTKGTNTIAVEVHNNSATSSDIYWDASLTASFADDSSATYYSTQNKINLPTGSVNLEAVFEIDENTTTSLRINEVSASNDVFVNDYFKKSDWIELYNGSNEDIDLEGMYLSNDNNEPLKYQITAGDSKANTIIKANGYKVIWCDGRQPKTELHAGFKIDNEGGVLILTATDQSWQDTFRYSAHNGEQAVGLYPDGGTKLYLMDKPTIASSNIYNSYAQAVSEEDLPSGINNTNDVSSNLSIDYAAGNLIIESDHATIVTVYSLSGQLLMTEKAKAGTTTINTAHLTAGCYVAKAESQGHTASTKFVRLSH